MGSLADRRKAAGLTQAQLADLVGVGISAIKAYENGRRRPAARVIMELYKALGLTASDIAQLYMKDGGAE
jgi:transcriptional regulator with XRE-family HTH domain